MSIITLTTDFGADDWFVGAMKGVILQINPRATLVDITHNIPAGQVRQGAFALRAAFSCFPRGTIHVVVVDPGVGGKRQAIVARSKDFLFIAPDNGVLAPVLAGLAPCQVREIAHVEFMRHPVSRTFHGRDVFAPVAAHLSRGRRWSEVGPRVKRLVQLSWPEPVAFRGGIKGEILYVDRFGNAITNIAHDRLSPNCRGTVRCGRRILASLSDHYGAVPVGQPVAVPGSTGLIEIAVNGGHAARQLRLQEGTKVSLVLTGHHS